MMLNYLIRLPVQNMTILIQLLTMTVIQLQHLSPPVFCSTELFMGARITVSKGMLSIGKLDSDFQSCLRKLTSPPRGSNDEQQKDLMDLT